MPYYERPVLICDKCLKEIKPGASVKMSKIVTYKATPLTPNDLATLRALHVEHEHENGCHRHLVEGRLVDSAGPSGYCNDPSCFESWPCLTARLLATLADAYEADSHD